jgi:hypothetical protein
MRRMNRSSGLSRDEAGVTAVFFLVLMTVLIGMAALVVDIGDALWERRMQQNSADAAALAVAADCAEGDCGTYTATAAAFSSANDHRGVSVEQVVGSDGVSPPDPADGEVTVVTYNESEQYFSGILGRVGGLDVRASATAAWWRTTEGRSIPLTFSSCEWDDLTGGLGADALPTGEQIVYFAFTPPRPEDRCYPDPPNLDFPGGFGWLDVVTTTGDPDAGQCIARSSLGEMDGDTGNTPPQPAASTGCTATFFRGLVDNETEVLMPIYGYVSGTGNNAVYTIVGYTGAVLTAFKLGGPPEWRYAKPEGAGWGCPDGNPNSHCVRLRLVQYYDVGSQPSVGGGDFGSISIGLIR